MVRHFWGQTHNLKTKSKSKNFRCCVFSPKTWKPTFLYWTLRDLIRKHDSNTVGNFLSYPIIPLQFFQKPKFTLLPNHKRQPILRKSSCCWTHLAITFFSCIFVQEIFLHKANSNELVRPTGTSGDELLMRKWEWVRTSEKLY